METLVKTLKERKLTISSCESLTGGAFASSIVSVSGASEVFVGDFTATLEKSSDVEW